MTALYNHARLLALGNQVANALKSISYLFLIKEMNSSLVFA